MAKDIPSPIVCSTLIRCAELERYAPEPEGEIFVPFLNELEYLIATQLEDDRNNDFTVTRIASPALYQEEAEREIDEVEGKSWLSLYDRSIEDVKHETPSYAFTQNLCALAKHGMTRLREAKDTFSRVILEKLQEEYVLADDQEFVYPEHYGESIDTAMNRLGRIAKGTKATCVSEKLYRMEMSSKKLRRCLQRIERVIWLEASIGVEEHFRLMNAKAKQRRKEQAIEAGKLKFANAWGNSLTNRTFYEVKAVPDNKRCLNGPNGCPTKCKLGREGYC